MSNTNDQTEVLDTIYIKNKMRSEYNSLKKDDFESKQYISDHDLNNISFLIQNNMDSLAHIFENPSDYTKLNSNILIKGEVLSKEKNVVYEKISFDSKESTDSLEFDEDDENSDSFMYVDFNKHSSNNNDLVIFSIINSKEDQLLEIGQHGDEIGFFLYDLKTDDKGEYVLEEKKKILTYNESNYELTTDFPFKVNDLVLDNSITVNNIRANSYYKVEDVNKDSIENAENADNTDVLGKTQTSMKVDSRSNTKHKAISFSSENGFITSINEDDVK